MQSLCLRDLKTAFVWVCMVSASGGKFFKRMNSCSLISNRVCFIEVRVSSLKDGSDVWKSAWWNFNCVCLLSAWEASTAIQQFRVRSKNCPSFHGGGTSWGSPRRGDRGSPEESDCAHPNGCHFSLSQSSLPAVEGRRDRTPQAEKFLRTRALLAASLQDIGLLPSLTAIPHVSASVPASPSEVMQNRNKQP